MCVDKQRRRQAFFVMPQQTRVITCPECETRVPLDPFETSAACPMCGAPISASASSPTSLPKVRGEDLVVHAPLSSNKAEWEPQLPPPREVSFQGALKSTEELRHTDRRRRKRVVKRKKAMAWDDKGQKRGGLKPIHWGILGGAAALVVVLAAALAVKVLFFQKAPPLPVAALPEDTPIGLSSTAPLNEADGRKVLEVIEAFLTAPSLADMAQYVREPEQVVPKMEKFYGDEEWMPMTVRYLPDVSELQTNGDLVAGKVEINDYQERLIALQRVGDTFKVDWEAFVGWCEVPWTELARQRPTISFLMRAKLVPDDYYNFDFQNPNDWVCYRLTSADGEHSIYGYVRRNKPLHASISEKLSQARFLMPTLKVSFRDTGASLNQVQIDAFVANGWVLNSAATDPNGAEPGTENSTSAATEATAAEPAPAAEPAAQ